MSLTLQGKDTTIQEATIWLQTRLTIQYLQRQHSDSSFDKFYSQVVEESKDLTSPPSLPRHRQPPKWIDVRATAHEFATLVDYFRKQYFEVLDLLINELKRRFQQKRGMPVVAVLEKLLLDSANGTSTLATGELPEELQLYKNDIDLAKLKLQLLMLPDLIRTRNSKSPNTVPIKKVTNVRTISEVVNDVGIGKEMLSEVFRLLQIFLHCQSPLPLPRGHFLL